MKLRRRYIILAALVIAGAAVYVFFQCRANSLSLEIRDAASGKIYGKWPIEEGGEFAIEFVHSVNQSPVKEIFKAQGKEIRVFAVRFYTFGAGMHSDLEEGQTLTRDGDAMVISGFSASYKELNYIVGTVSDHLLFINNEIISLRDLCGRNANITLRLK
jgi:hypothetical protein